MNRKQGVVPAIILLFFLFTLATCGKKGPPFLPEKEISFRVDQLKAKCQNGIFYLKGKVVDSQIPADAVPDIAACRVYHACYPVDHPPCEGCPIDYGPFRSIKGRIVIQGNFSCQIPVKAKKGIHFFKVRLIGREGGIGPFSDRVKLIIGQ